jgi:hypothetical protein
LRLKSGHAALLVVHLEQPNFSPRALPGLISGSNAPIIQLLTGPRANGAYLRDIVLIFKETMATEAHGKHGIYTENFLCLPWIPWLFMTILT